MIITITLNCAIDRVVEVQRLALNQINRGILVSALPGGKGLNVSRTLKVLNEPLVAWGFVGGKNGEFIEQGLKEEGILSEFVMIDEESRICMTYIDKHNQTLTEINENGPTISSEALAELQHKLKTLTFKPEAVVLSGSLPREMPHQVYADLIKMIPFEDVTTVLDAKGEALKEGLKAHPTVIKPNRYEASEILGVDITMEPSVLHHVVDSFLDMGTQIVALSLDEDGAVIGSRDGCWLIRSPKLQTVNTVGSGDAFVAGLVKGLRFFDTLKDAGRLAVACGAANTLVQGAGKCHLEDIRAFMEELEAVGI